MRIREAKQCIKEIYLHTDSVSALISERGVGKTSAYRQCADELGIGYMGLYAAAMEGLDIVNLLIRKIVTEFDGSAAHLENMNAFVNCLPQELKILFFKLLATKRPEHFEQACESFDAFPEVIDKVVDLMRM